jgi:NTE family protein
VVLGSGGARGIVHIAYMEAIEELGLAPAVIAGTSMGALLGAGWASGMRAADLRDYVTRVVTLREIAGRLWLSGTTSLREIGLQWQIDTASIVASYLPDDFPPTFDDLRVPFRAVATDYFGGEQHVFASGPLFSALAASLAIPGVFRPVRVEGRLYIDGGATNPLPADHARELADVLVAIDVNGAVNEAPAGTEDPGLFDVGFGAMQIMTRALTQNVLVVSKPELYVQAPVSGFRVLEFWRASEILARADAEKDQFKRDLDAAIKRWEL